ncbi:MAG: AbrB/MazE/SpoVT family DNA-binding domain-containing protein [Pseudomonadota bacterium]|nr:MAG: AbrB family transcriptional regulator [Pseudomonadota bacterium]
METTRLSSKGQVIIPKGIRESRGWKAGTELIVEEHPDGVLLRSWRVFTATRIEDVAGCLRRRRQPKSLEEMDEAVTSEARRRWRAFQKQ